MLFIFLWLFITCTGYIHGRSKGVPVSGALVCMLLGPFGHIVIAMQRSTVETKCPVCFGSIHVAALKCMHCGSDTKRKKSL